MKIKSIELIEIQMPLVHFFETSFGRTYERRIILTRVVDEDGNEGWGECTCGRNSFLFGRMDGLLWEVMEKILAPMVIGKEFESAEDSGI